VKRPIELTEELSEGMIQKLSNRSKMYPKEPIILGFMSDDMKRTDIKITRIKDGRVWGKEVTTYDPKDVIIKDVK